MMYTKYTTTFAGGALAAMLCVVQVAPAAAQDTRTVFLDAGTVIPVRLRDPLSSADSRKGDRFRAVLKSPEDARSLQLPVGTAIEGTVSAVRPQRDKDPGVLSLSFNRITLPNEATFPIQGSLIGLDNKSVTHDSSGRLVAKSDQKDKTLMYAGYGAGAGLLLSAVTRGNTFLDTILGGGLGYLFGSLDKSHGDPRDVKLKADTEMGVRLDRGVKITTYFDGNDAPGYSVTEKRPPLPGDRDQDRLRERDDNSIARDPDRDPYDTPDRRDRPGMYGVLRQFTDIRDNGRPIRVLVEGDRISFLPEARPFIANGTVMVPAVPILKAEHIRYTYTPTTFRADGPGEPLTATFGSRAVTGSSTHRFMLPTAAIRRNGTVYVPIQFLAIVTGQDLNFDRDTQTVELGGPPPAYDQDGDIRDNRNRDNGNRDR